MARLQNAIFTAEGRRDYEVTNDFDDSGGFSDGGGFSDDNEFEGSMIFRTMKLTLTTHSQMPHCWMIM